MIINRKTKRFRRRAPVSLEKIIEFEQKVTKGRK